MEYIRVSWPESQMLNEFSGFFDNCKPIANSAGDYLVNKEWYDKLCAGELKEMSDEEWEANED